MVTIKLNSFSVYPAKGQPEWLDITVTFRYTIGMNIPYTSFKRENKDLQMKRIRILIWEKTEKSNQNLERLKNVENTKWSVLSFMSKVFLLSESVSHSIFLSFVLRFFLFSILCFGIFVTINMCIIAITTSAHF